MNGPRRATLGLVGLSLAIAAAFVVVNDEPATSTGTGATVSTATTTTDSATTMIPLDPSVVEKAYAPQANRRFITVGTTDNRQFDEAQLEDIAANYDVVVFAKFHAGWDVRLHHEATRLLKELNPDLEVFAYMSTKYWFEANRWDGAEIDSDWFLQDNDGEAVPVNVELNNPESKRLGSYVDVSNDAYRDWLLSVARAWMSAAPYDGIRFDAADPIGDFGDHDIKRWEDLLSPERIAVYNDGIETLLTTFSNALAPKEIFFNGISPNAIRGPGRDLFMLEITDGAMDESFCVSREGELHDILADIEIMEQYSNKSLQLRAPYPGEAPEAERPRLGRVCVATFLMGWQPGSTYFNMGSGYGVEQLIQQPPEIDLNLGEPTGAMTSDGDLLSRAFDNGMVYLNLGTEPVDIELPEDVVLWEEGSGEEMHRGTYTLDGEDAAHFLFQDFLTNGVAG